MFCVFLRLGTEGSKKVTRNSSFDTARRNTASRLNNQENEHVFDQAIST